MLKTTLLKDIAAQLSDVLPSHLHVLKEDVEKNCHSILIKAFAKFDLVTRDEFDIQTNVLLRTREKVEALEKQLKIMEDLLKDKCHK